MRRRGLGRRAQSLIGVTGILVLAVLSAVAFYSDDLPLIGGGTTYLADFSEASGLKAGNEVRVAGVKVGKVTDVALAGAHVKVTFKVKDTWVGDGTTAAIKIKTLLGDKYLALDPAGLNAQRPDRPIPLSRTTSPYDVQQALSDLSTTVGKIDTGQLARSFDSLSSAFANTPPNVRAALTGMSRLSITISSRDRALARLLRGTRTITGTLAGQNRRFTALLKDGNVLLGMLRTRRRAIHGMLVGTTRMSRELSGLVGDNDKQLGPMLKRLDRVTKVLSDNQRDLDRGLALAGPYYRMVGNTVGNGRWIDAYLCGLVPKSYAPETVPDSGCRPPKGTR